MKTIATFLIAGLSLLGLSGCANGKSSQEQTKDRAYFVVEEGQEARDLSDIKLFIPLSKLPNQEVQLDSVYFRGRKAALTPVGKEDSGIYVAVFENSGRSKDMVMSSDPKEEFGNKAPVLPEKIPYELGEDEVVVVFSKNGKKGSYKLDGVVQRE